MTNRSVQPYGSNDSTILVHELFKTHCLMVQFDARSLQVTHAIKKRNPMELRCAHATTCNRQGQASVSVDPIPCSYPTPFHAQPALVPDPPPVFMPATPAGFNPCKTQTIVVLQDGDAIVPSR